jgi:hypothetical protein
MRTAKPAAAHILAPVSAENSVLIEPVEFGWPRYSLQATCLRSFSSCFSRYDKVSGLEALDAEVIALRHQLLVVLVKM